MRVQTNSGSQVPVPDPAPSDYKKDSLEGLVTAFIAGTCFSVKLIYVCKVRTTQLYVQTVMQ